jgi:hypothetical protein
VFTVVSGLPMLIIFTGKLTGDQRTRLGARDEKWADASSTSDFCPLVRRRSR